MSVRVTIREDYEVQEYKMIPVEGRRREKGREEKVVLRGGEEGGWLNSGLEGRVRKVL